MTRPALVYDLDPGDLVQTSYLSRLACPGPSPSRGGRCQGRLGLASSSGPPARFAPEDPEELVEGAVRCERCRTVYPVLAGVLVLVPRPLDYLGHRFSSVTSWAGLHGGVSEEAARWLVEQRLPSYETRPLRDAPDTHVALHFEEAAELWAETDLPATFQAFLEESRDRGPYAVLEDMARRWPEPEGGPETGSDADPSPRRLAVDAGCGVGGLTHRLAGHYRTVLGIDLSFTSVWLARSIVLHRPTPHRYRVLRQRDVFEERTLPVTPRSNVELLVADCSRLPLADGCADAVASANVLELVHPRRPLEEAGRILRTGGLLLLTDPFKFRIGHFPPPPEGHLEATRRRLSTLGFDLLEERDMVPWIWYHFERQAQVYFNYCAACVKGEPATDPPPGRRGR